MAADSSDNLYIADTGNQRIRKVEASAAPPELSVVAPVPRPEPFVLPQDADQLP